MPIRPGKFCDGLVEALPLAGNGGAGLPSVTLAEAGDEQRLAGFETRRLKIIDDGRIHGDRLLKLKIVEMRRAADRFGRDPEMVAERAGECFVRAVIRIQRDAEDIGSAICERARGLAETAGTHIAHDRQPRRGGKRPHHVETRDSADGRDLIESQRIGKMAFDKPERLLGRIHGQRSSFEALRIMDRSRDLHLIVLAPVSLRETGTRKPCSASRKIAAKALLATSVQLCILRLHSIRRLKKRPDKNCLSLGQHVREDDNA